MTLSRTPIHCTECAAASAAPTSPPISAWDDDGSPNHQVIRFQAIAPINAANTICTPPLPVGASMMPPPTVLATLVEISVFSRFAAAASASASFGVSALVDPATGPRPDASSQSEV